MLRDLSIPIIPISACRELPGCLATLRQQYSSTSAHFNKRNGEIRDLVSYCVKGKPLSRDQTNVVTGMSSGFRDLASHVTLPDSQVVLKKFLETDGERIISFFTDGPVTTDF